MAEFDFKLIMFIPRKPWCADRFYGIDVNNSTDADSDAASTTEEAQYADTDIWACPDADAVAVSTIVEPMPERFSDSTSMI